MVNTPTLQNPAAGNIDVVNSLGTIFSEEVSLSNRLYVFGLPLGKSEDSGTITIFGAKRQIIISGGFSGEGYSDVSYPTLAEKFQQFVVDMEVWVNANSQTKRTYTSSIGQVYTVFCDSFDFTINPPGTRLLYTLVMVEGASLGDLAKSILGF